MGIVQLIKKAVTACLLLPHPIRSFWLSSSIHHLRGCTLSLLFFSLLQFWEKNSCCLRSDFCLVKLCSFSSLLFCTSLKAPEQIISDYSFALLPSVQNIHADAWEWNLKGRMTLWWKKWLELDCWDWWGDVREWFASCWGLWEPRVLDALVTLDYCSGKGWN